jgi:hypothetical protein
MTGEEKEVIRQLSLELFETFSRMEYALKAARYWKRQNKAEANWDSFVSAIKDSFHTDHSNELKTAYDYILLQPPNKQMIVDGALVWKAVPADGDELLQLGVYIRRVRNNLFHGGKYGDHALNFERNRALISHSLTLLLYLKTLHPEVEHIFDH